MRRCVCPGSFDPVTNGHLDVVGRAARLYDEVTIAVLVNAGKQALFTVEERMDLLRQSLGEWPNVQVESFGGLLVDFCRDRDIPVVVKGLRAVSDFDYELQMAQMNYRLSELETAFLATSPNWSFLSSSMIKNIAFLGGDITGLVPDPVRDALVARARPSGDPGE